MSDKPINKSTKKKNYQSINTNIEDADKDHGIQNTPKMLFGYPVQVFYLFGNEFCERFTYFGIHAILVIYFVTIFELKNNEAVALFHAFEGFCYLLPILGAILADNYLGRFRTIFSLSVVYVLGTIVMSVTAIPSIVEVLKLSGPIFGLLLISLGTGGIKPCIIVFAADQLEEGQEKTSKMYSIFYFFISIGTLSSMLLTPILRENVNCFGNDCYLVAFGVPTLLMMVALMLFLSGRNMYKKVPPEGNTLVYICTAVWSAVKNRYKSRGSGMKKSHWIEWASDKYSAEMKMDIRALFKVLLMFLPMPLYWTLYLQQASHWTLQATEMDGDIGVLGTIPPDQMQASLPILLMILIPFVETIVYPVAKKCHLLKKPLQRMLAGMTLAIVSFIVTGILQMQIHDHAKFGNLPAAGHANYRIVNVAPCGINLNGENLTNGNFTLPYAQATDYFQVPVKFDKFSVIGNCLPNGTHDLNVNVKELESYTLTVGKNRTTVVSTQFTDYDTQPKFKQARVRFFYAGGTIADQVTIYLNNIQYTVLQPFEKRNYIDIYSKSYTISVDSNSSKTLAKDKVTFENGKIYTIVIQPDETIKKIKILEYTDLTPQRLSILWQIPQYFVITLSEVFFAIPLLEFAYSQAPSSMKSCIMAISLLTISVGSLLVIVIKSLHMTDDMAIEFFIYATLQAVVTVIFAVMSWFYKYKDYGVCHDDYRAEGGGGKTNTDDNKLPDKEIK